MRHLLAVTVILCSIMVFAEKTDSVGTKVKNGKVYILHKVEKGQGMYSISKRYGVPLKTLIDENPGSDKVIRIDHIIWVPTEKEPVMEEKVVKDYFESNDIEIEEKPDIEAEKENTTEVTTFAKYHVVSAGETLYGISKKYNTTVEMIQTLNDMESTTLAEGQKLLVQDGKAVTRTVDVETDYEEVKEKLEATKYEDLGFDTEVETETKVSSTGYSIKVEKLVEYNIEKVEETGVGEIGGDGVPTDKNFASHFNAPLGTVIMVTNPENEKTVFVKVTGNFVKEENSASILKLSEQSAKQIGFETGGKLLLSYAR